MRAAEHRHFVAFVVALLGIAWGACTAFSQQQAKGTQAKPAKTSSKLVVVQEITLPEYSSDPAPGPNQQTYQKHCLLCHSNRYVEMQPNFSRAVWEKEVKKMVDAYGAPVSASDQLEIVEYLVSIRGSAESK